MGEEERVADVSRFFLAHYLLESIDESIEPCENFFRFACGTWLKNNRIPDDSSLSFPFDSEIVFFCLKPVLKIHSMSYEINWITMLLVNGTVPSGELWSERLSLSRYSHLTTAE